jgi:hypothetical protein
MIPIPTFSSSSQLAIWNNTNGPTPDFWLLEGGIDTVISSTWLNNHSWAKYTKSTNQSIITAFTVMNPSDPYTWYFSNRISTGVRGHTPASYSTILQRVFVETGFTQESPLSGSAGKRIIFNQAFNQFMLFKTISQSTSFTATGISVNVNGFTSTQVSTSSSGAPLWSNFTINTSGVLLSNNPNQSINPTNIKEILLYFGTLSSGQTTTVENYLKNKWNISY